MRNFPFKLANDGIARARARRYFPLDTKTKYTMKSLETKTIDESLTNLM